MPQTHPAAQRTAKERAKSGWTTSRVRAVSRGWQTAFSADGALRYRTRMQRMLAWFALASRRRAHLARRQTRRLPHRHASHRPRTRSHRRTLRPDCRRKSATRAARSRSVSFEASHRVGGTSTGALATCVTLHTWIAIGRSGTASLAKRAIAWPTRSLGSDAAQHIALDGFSPPRLTRYRVSPPFQARSASRVPPTAMSSARGSVAWRCARARTTRASPPHTAIASWRHLAAKPYTVRRMKSSPHHCHLCRPPRPRRRHPFRSRHQTQPPRRLLRPIHRRHRRCHG